MRAGQPKILAQKLHQQRAGFDIAGNGFSVHGHGYGRHEHPPKKVGVKSPLIASPGKSGSVSGPKSSRFQPGCALERA
jgi:hypothetical protein